MSENRVFFSPYFEKCFLFLFKSNQSNKRIVNKRKVKNREKLISTDIISSYKKKGRMSIIKTFSDEMIF